MFLFYTYNFYFENQIYKWMKQFENQYRRPYFLGNFLVGVRVVFLPNYPLVLSLLK